MPLNKRNVPLPPDDDGDEDVMASRSMFRYVPERYRDDSPLPPDPPGREDIMAPEPSDSREPGRGGGRPR